MASGDISYQTGGSKLVILLDAIAATGTDDGVWIDCADFETGCVTWAGGTGAAVVQVDVSNAVTKPANNTHGVTEVTSAAATDGRVYFTSLPRWLKARISVLGTGTVTALALLRTSDKS